MAARYEVWGLWDARKESADECAARAEAFFRCIGACAPELAEWFRRGRSLKEALKHRVTPDAAALRAMMVTRRKRAGASREVTERVGFSVGVWNGASADEHSAAVHITCGAYSPAFPNSCSLALPREGPASERLLHTPVLVELMHCMINAWDPDYGLVHADSYMKARPDMFDYAPRIGWLIYISRRLGRAPPLPAPASIVPVENKGALIIVTPDRFTGTNPSHVEAADRIAAALDRSGLRKRLK
jgi:hypothetical protein